MELDIPTAVPLVYELDAELKPIRHYYLRNKKINSKERHFSHFSLSFVRF